MDDKIALARSHAGIRLIAMMTLFNRGDMTRLRAYIDDNFTGEALAQHPTDMRLAEWDSLRVTAQKWRVRQILATDKYQVVVLMESATGSYSSHDIKVEEDYPHLIIEYTQQSLS